MPDSQPRPVELLKPQQLCDRLQIDRRTLLRMTLAGEIPVIKLRGGNILRYDPVDVMEAIENPPAKKD